MPTEPTEPSARAGEAPSLRDKILEVAEPLFARQGFASLGMRELAERVGMSKSALFHHFPSKVALYEAVLERAVQRLETLLEHAPDDPLARLHLWVDRFIDALAEHPSLAPLLLRTFFEDDVAELAEVDATVQRMLARVAECLAQGRESGAIRPVSVPHTIQTLIGMTVYHFASGDFGELVLGEPVFSSRAVHARKEHVRDYIDRALADRGRNEPCTSS